MLLGTTMADDFEIFYNAVAVENAAVAATGDYVGDLEREDTG